MSEIEQRLTDAIEKSKDDRGDLLYRGTPDPILVDALAEIRRLTPEPAPKLDAAVIERAASEAIVLIDEINKHAPSRRFNGINQPLHRKLATIRATLARALRPALDAREGG